MKKLILAVSLFLLFSFSIHEASASILTIDNQGRLIVNVLSSEDTLALIPQADYLEVKKISGSGVFDKAEISLSNTDGKIALNILTDAGEKDLDVTNISDNLIEIEAKEETKKLQIRSDGGKFLLEQNGLVASTSYPIKINPKEKHIFVTTPTGERYLSLLPLDAAQSALRAKIVNNLDNKDMVISEDANGELAYKVDGEKVINIFKIVNYSYPVSVDISAQTGEVLSDTTPIWLKILGFVIG